MIINHNGILGVAALHVVEAVRLFYVRLSYDAKVWGGAAIVLFIIVGFLVFHVVHTRINEEIDKREYDRVESYVTICPTIKEDVVLAFDNDGIISNIEYSEIRNKCDDYIELTQKDRSKAKLKELINEEGSE